MGHGIDRPKLEGNIAIGDRRLGFAEFGDPQGRAVFWLHGTPGARRQIPAEARIFAEQKHIRLIGVDRPGIGSSTPYQYDTVSEFGHDLQIIADVLGHSLVPGDPGSETTARGAAMMAAMQSGIKGSFIPVGGPFLRSDEICRAFIASVQTQSQPIKLQGTACRPSGGEWAVKDVGPWKGLS